MSRLLVAVLVITAACSSNETSEASNTSSAAVAETSNTVSSPENTGPVTLTAADIDAFEKGIARETQLVREAQQRASSAATPQERGEASQAAFETTTIPAAAPVTGLSAERYKLVRETIATIMTTLDFKGEIDGPQSIDTARAGAEMKARVAGDAYAPIDAQGAALLKSRLNTIAPLWIEYINLTVVGG